MAKKTDKKLIVILDAHAIIHRAYHALPSFTNSSGVATGALYGITSMLMRIIEELKPDAIVAAYDLPKPTFRHLSYEGYKAGRVKAEDDLVSQIVASREIFTAFGIPILDAEGFEADDVIGTLVEQYKNDDEVAIIIASGDMDTMQLVTGKKVQVFTLKRGVRDTVLYDEDAVFERFGFAPMYLVDYKGLRGDPSDNIIGVKGVGDKNATAIIQEFGTIESLYESLEKNDVERIAKAGLSKRMVTTLLEHKEDAFFSKTLATIRRDAPVTFPIESGEYKKHASESLIRELFARYEFPSLLSRVRKIFVFEADEKEEEVDEVLLKEASIALWVLYSEQTNPTKDMILQRTRKKVLADAYEAILDELKQKDGYAIFEKIEKPIIPIIDGIHKKGVKIDIPYYQELSKKMKAVLVGLEQKIHEIAEEEVNINSPKQLSKILFDKLMLKPKGKRKESGAFTTSAEVLEDLRGEHEIVGLILEYREVQKLLSTYVDAFLSHVQADGRVHATFLQHGTATGRFSSVNPNMQNIPNSATGMFTGGDIRKGIIADEGKVFVGSDYAQIELRMLAMLSKDERLMESFVRGDDVHATVASYIFKKPITEVTSDMRRAAKVVNFGILFGMGVSALQKNLGSTREEAQRFYTDYFESFPAVTAYLEASKESAKTKGYTTTLFGRKRYFPGTHANAPFLRAIAERMASNAPIQGTAADVIKIAIALIDTDLRAAGLTEKAALVFQIHDELIYEVDSSVQKEVSALIEKAMTSVFSRSPIEVSEPFVPLVVSTGVGKHLDELKG